MILLALSVFIALTMILLGMLIVGRAGKSINLDRLQIFIAIASGFMLAVLFVDLLPENLEKYPLGNRNFFCWCLAGMALVIFFERYLVTRLYFVETFFKTDDNSLIPTETHDHHHDTDLSDAKDCVHSHQQGHQHAHQHSHVHQHTHLEVMGKGEVCSAIACFMICSFFDGIALASVQVVNAKLGLLLVIGVVLHLLPEGILSGAMALAGGANLKSAQKILFFIGGAFVLGSLIPFIFHGFEYTFLALSSGIILFVTMVQLLPTALRLNYAPLWISSGILLYLGSHAVLSGIGVSI